MSEPPAVQIQFSAEFKSQLRSLAKRYRQIRSDLQPLSIASKPEISQAIRSRVLDLQSSKSESKTVTSAKVSAQAIG
jgi:mRNA-degrading endonuclease RelE of RelBE toxin-antitoxin system